MHLINVAKSNKKKEYNIRGKYGKFTGKVWVLGDDIDTDIIIPTEYLALKTIDDMKQYGFSPLRPELAGQISKR